MLRTELFFFQNTSAEWSCTLQTSVHASPSTNHAAVNRRGTENENKNDETVLGPLRARTHFECA